MKKLITTKVLVVSAVICSVSVSAQDYKTYDISSYYTPDITRNSLYFTGNTTVNGKNQSNETSNNGNYSLYSNFTSVKDTRKMIRNISTSVSGSGSFDNYNSESLDNKKTESILATGVGLDAEYKLYGSKKKFIDFALYAYGNYNYNKVNNTSQGVSKLFYRHTLNPIVSGHIGIGIGRLENVTEANQAVYLVEALTKNQILSTDLTHEQIFQLAQEMSKIKNKRFLDARLRQMAEVSHIDSFFVSNKLLKESGARYFTNLYDIWINGANFLRNSGQTIELIVKTAFNENYSTYKPLGDTNEIKDVNSYLMGSVDLNYVYEKPFHQKWQHSVYTNLAYRLNSNENIRDNIHFADNYTQDASLLLNYKIGFYPNTRTNLYINVYNNISAVLGPKYTNNGNETSNDKLIWGNTTILKAGTYYYFSPQLRFSATASITNQRGLNDVPTLATKHSDYFGSLQAGFTYFLF